MPPEAQATLVLARTSDGRKRAMERGVRFGRKPKLSQFQIAEALDAASIARKPAGCNELAIFADNGHRVFGGECSQLFASAH